MIVRSTRHARDSGRMRSTLAVVQLLDAKRAQTRAVLRLVHCRGNASASWDRGVSAGRSFGRPPLCCLWRQHSASCEVILFALRTHDVSIQCAPDLSPSAVITHPPLPSTLQVVAGQPSGGSPAVQQSAVQYSLRGSQRRRNSARSAAQRCCLPTLR